MMGELNCDEIQWNLHKQPPKCQAWVTHRRWSLPRALTIVYQILPHLHMVTPDTWPHYKCVIPPTYMYRKSLWRKNTVPPKEKFLFLVVSKNTIMLQHLIIHYSLYHRSTGCLQEVKNKRKFQTYSFKSGRGRLWEVVTYKRFQI